jgi:hypothetical protein
VIFVPPVEAVAETKDDCARPGGTQGQGRRCCGCCGWPDAPADAPADVEVGANVNAGAKAVESIYCKLEACYDDERTPDLTLA